MNNPAFLEEELELEDPNSADNDSDVVTLIREVHDPLVTRRRVEDLLERKRLERELLEFDLREDYSSSREWEEE